MLDIDTAIKHCLEVAEKNETLSEWGERNKVSCLECAADHRQLAEWLTKMKELEAKHWDECRQIAHYDDELKDLREENKVLIRECDRLIKEKGELLSKVSGSDVLRICQLEKELEKAKRLLKAAVEDMRDVANNGTCNHCVLDGLYAQGGCCTDGCYKWRYADEVKRLLRGGDTNG